MLRGPKKLTRKDLNLFGFLWLALFMVMGLNAWYRGTFSTTTMAICLSGVAVGLMAFAIPSVMRLLYHKRPNR